MPQTDWAETKSDWLPIGLAVIAFVARTKGMLRECEERLLRESRATQVSIDPVKSTFRFLWMEKGEPSILIGGRPWLLVSEHSSEGARPLHAPKRRSSHGAVEIRTFSERGAQLAFDGTAQIRATSATASVWRHLILRRFNDAVERRLIKIYARIGGINTDFKPIGADVWPLLTVVDWERGEAVADDERFSSMHVDLARIDTDGLIAEPAVPLTSKRKGRRPEKRNATEQAMRDDVQRGIFSLSYLQEMTQDALAAQYNVSRETAVTALRNVWAEIATKPNSDN